MKKKESRVDEAYKLFFDALISEGVEGIINVAHDIFECPILFTDQYYRLICQVPNTKIGKPVWDAIYENKVPPADVIEAYQALYIKNKFDDDFAPFYCNTGIAKEYPQIFGDIQTNNIILGHVAIYKLDKPLLDDDLEIAKILLDSLKIVLTRREKDSGRWRPTISNYLLDMLDENTSPQLKQIAMDNLKKNIPGSYTLIISSLGHNSSEKISSAYVVSELSRRYRSIGSAIYDNCIVTLIGEVRPLDFDPHKSRFIDGIVEFLSAQNLISGICDSFDDLSEIHFRYQQAFMTAMIATARHNSSLAAYRDYLPLQMFLNIPGINIPKNIFMHPVLAEIQRYDNANNTEYFNTLRIYSLTMHNKDSAAMQLDVHRNTLLYRLNRIKDLFNLSYEDEQTAVHLLCSFLLMEANYLIN